MTALHIASSNSNVEIVQLLLTKENIDINTKSIIQNLFNLLISLLWKYFHDSVLYEIYF